MQAENRERLGERKCKGIEWNTVSQTYVAKGFVSNALHAQQVQRSRRIANTRNADSMVKCPRGNIQVCASVEWLAEKWLTGDVRDRQEQSAGVQSRGDEILVKERVMEGTNVPPFPPETTPKMTSIKNTVPMAQVAGADENQIIQSLLVPVKSPGFFNLDQEEEGALSTKKVWLFIRKKHLPTQVLFPDVDLDAREVLTVSVKSEFGGRRRLAPLSNEEEATSGADDASSSQHLAPLTDSEEEMEVMFLVQVTSEGEVTDTTEGHVYRKREPQQFVADHGITAGEANHAGEASHPSEATINPTAGFPVPHPRLETPAPHRRLQGAPAGGRQKFTSRW
ncbi:hypothetical protein B0H13DRAFT_1856417 [Mycena leptocephala]|nr:hypothetical protein B0H13DRAFT_1856417 [Mycena leptocephala]